MMYLNDSIRTKMSDDCDGDSSVNIGEEIPVWIRGEQRFVSGVTEETTCYDVIQVLLKDEKTRGRHTGLPEQYQITERWRGVEQSLEPYAPILDIWNTWGSAQSEVKLSLRRIKSERALTRRTKCRSDMSLNSDLSAFKTIHPKRLNVMQSGKEPSSTEELLKLVLAQGEVIRRQLKKLRHSEHQIGHFEEKAHKARVKKHGSNYLLETYLKGLSEAAEPEALTDNICLTDKNSDSGVMTEGDSEKSHNASGKASSSGETHLERLSPTSEGFKEGNDEDASSTTSETVIKEQLDLLEKIIKINKTILREEEHLVKLNANLKKCEENEAKERAKEKEDERVVSNLTKLRTDMAKSSCEMQHNEVVLEETLEQLEKRRKHLESLHKDLAVEDHEYDMLQALMFTNMQHGRQPNFYNNPRHTKEMLDTLV